MSTPENAGAIYAEIRLALNQMEKDGVDAQKAMDRLAVKFKQKGEESGKQYVQGFGKAGVQINQRLNNMVSSLNGVSPKMGALGEKMAGVFSKPIFAMVPAVSMAFKAMLPVIGTVIAAVTLLTKGIQKFIASNNEKITNIKLATKTSEMLKNMTIELAAAQNASADALARQAAGTASLNFDGNVKSSKELKNELIEVQNEIYLMREGFTKFDDSRFNELIKQASSLRKQIKETKEAEKQAAENIKALQNDIKKGYSEHLLQLANIKKANEANIKTSLEAKNEEINATEKLIESLIQQRTVAATLADRNNEARHRVKELDDAIYGLTDQLKELKKASELEGIYKGITDAVTEYKNLLVQAHKESELRNHDEIEAMKTSLALQDKYIDALIRQRNELAKTDNLGAANEEVKILENVIKDNVRLRDIRTKELELKEKGANLQKEIDEAQLRALEKFNQAETRARQSKKDGFIEEAEMNKQIESARANLYSDYQSIIMQYGKAADGIIAQRNATAELVKAEQDRNEALGLTKSIEDQLTQLKIDQLRADASSAKTEEEKNRLLNEALDIEKDILKARRELERDSLKRIIEKNDILSDDDRDRILTDFDKITDGMLKIKNLGEDVSNSKFFEKFADNVQRYGSAIGEVITVYAELQSTLIQKSVDEQLKALDKLYNGKDGIFAMLEKEKQERLYQKGFIEAQTEEQHQRELELAIESGNHQRIFHAQNELEKFLIEEEFENKRLALEEEMNKQRAQLEYEAAMAKWKSQKIAAFVSGAQAVIEAAVNPWPVPALPMMAIATASTAAQIGIINANKPIPQFQDGGIVPGNSYVGDNVLTRQNSREMDLNLKQQKNLFNAINNNELGGEKEIILNVSIPVYLDGREITKIVVQHINNRQELIDKRSIK